MHGRGARNTLRFAGGPRQRGTPRAGVGRRRRAGAEVGEDLVDHRRLRDARDPHRAMAGWARDRVDLKDLLEQSRPAAGSLGRSPPSCGDDRRRPVGCGGLRFLAHALRERLAYQPKYRVVTCPSSVIWTNTRVQELQRVGGLGPCRRTYYLGQYLVDKRGG